MCGHIQCYSIRWIPGTCGSIIQMYSVVKVQRLIKLSEVWVCHYYMVLPRLA